MRLLLSYPYIMRGQNMMTKSKIFSFLDVKRSPRLFLIIVISLISPVHIALLSASLSPAMFVERDCLRSSKITLIFSRSEEDDPSAAVTRRNQTTAVILCGVIGALFDLEQEQGETGETLFRAI